MDNNISSEQYTEDTVKQNESLQRIMDINGTRQQVTEEDTVDQNESLTCIKENNGTSTQLSVDKVDQDEALACIMENNNTITQLAEDKVDQNEALQSIIGNSITSSRLTDASVDQNEALPRIMDNNGTSQQLTEDTVDQNESLTCIMENNGTDTQLSEDKVDQNEALACIMENNNTITQLAEDKVDQNESSNINASEALNYRQNTDENVDKNKALKSDICLEKNSTSRGLNNDENSTIEGFNDDLQADYIVDQIEGLTSEPYETGSDKSESLNSVLSTDITDESEVFESNPSLENKVIKDEAENFPCNTGIENDVITCDPCMKDGDQVGARGYCEGCTNYLCDVCLSLHHRQNPWRSHRLYSIKEFLEGTCPEHEDSIMEYYCEDDKVLGCSICMPLKHRICNITYLPNNFTQLENMGNGQKLNEDMFTLKGELETGKIEIQSYKKQVEGIAEKAISDVTAFSGLLISEIVSIEKAMINTVKQMKKKDNRCLDKVLQYIRDIEENLKCVQYNFNRKIETGCPGTQMYQCLRKSIDDVKEVQGVFNNIMGEEPGITSYQFQPSNYFLNMFSTETKQFGCFKTRSEKSEENDDSQASKIASTNKKLEPVQISDVAQAKASDKIKDVKLAVSSSTAKIYKNTSVTAVQSSASVFGQYVNEIDVKAVTDKQTCVITGMTMIDNQRMAVCDFANCCVKIIDINKYKLTFRLQMNSPPYEAAFTGKHLAVTQPEKGILAIITDIKSFKSTIYCHVGAECRGIAYRDVKFFISFKTNPAIIKVFRETGEILRTFRSVGGDTFHHPCHLALHPSRAILYVSDWQVAILGFDGSLVRKHRDLGFKDLKGVSVSNDGNLYVCDRGRNVVYVLLPMVTDKRVILDASHGITKPYTLLATGRNRKDKKLYVSMDESNVIKVFQISTL